VRKTSIKAAGANASPGSAASARQTAGMASASRLRRVVVAASSSTGSQRACQRLPSANGKPG
jgi:hypothetical protein